MRPDASNPLLIDDELDVLADLVPLAGQHIVELGCGAAQLSRALLVRHADSRVTGLEVDERQHAKNLAAPQAGLTFIAAGAQAIPFPDASFHLALMLKSLHHVPVPLMAQALGEVARVVRPGGHLYVSEPVYGGAFNEVIRVFNDEGVVGPRHRRRWTMRWARGRGRRWPNGASRCRCAFGTSPTSSNA